MQNDYIFYSLHGLGTDELSINSYSVITTSKKLKKTTILKNPKIDPKILLIIPSANTFVSLSKK